MIRIVGLSATLPNYIDVASFLHVNPYQGLFYFDSRFRPVPLGLTFCGVKAMSRLRQMEEMDRLSYEKALHFCEKGDQVSILFRLISQCYALFDLYPGSLPIIEIYKLSSYILGDLYF